MEYITLTRERNHRLTLAVRQKMTQLRLEKATDNLITQVIGEPVERGFFVSVDHIVVMDRRRREGKLPKMSDRAHQMWQEIFRTFDDYLAKRPSETRLNAAIHVAARGRASRFFITQSNARRIIKATLS